MSWDDKDITFRLRYCGCCDSHEGADEIELLRSTVTDCRLEIERLRAESQNAYERIKTLTTERDEARRSICALDADIMENQIEYAKHRGWDCFKENSK